MGSGRLPGPLCQVARPVCVLDGTLCLQPSSPPVSIGTSFDPVATWSLQTKLLEAARRATPKLPAEMREQFDALFSPTNIGITGGVLAIWGASHLVGVGQAADVVLLGAGVIGMGSMAWTGGQNLGTYLSLAANARNSDDLDRAANHLAQAVIGLGVLTLVAFFTRSASRIKQPAKSSTRQTAAAAEAGEKVTVARWMSRDEYNKMVQTKRVQPGRDADHKNVIYPPNPTAYKNAKAGEVYVEFDVPKASLSEKSAGQMMIYGPTSPKSRLDVQRGLPPREYPEATNIRLLQEK